MNSHNEKKKYLELGKRKYDISNIPYGRIVICSDMWDETVESHKSQDIKRAELQSLINEIAVYLIRQPLKVLLRRYIFPRAIYEYIKRFFVSVKYLESLDKDEYEKVEDFVYFQLTGKKKANLEIKKGLLDLMTEMVEEVLSKTNLNHETYVELLRTYHKGIVEQSMNSTQGQ